MDQLVARFAEMFAQAAIEGDNRRAELAIEAAIRLREQVPAKRAQPG